MQSVMLDTVEGSGMGTGQGGHSLGIIVFFFILKLEGFTITCYLSVVLYIESDLFYYIQKIISPISLCLP